MTLLGAVRQGSNFLIASDGKQMVTDNHSWGMTSEPVDKLLRIGDSVVWGYQGAMDIGEAFREFVETSAPYQSWDRLAEVCGPSLRTLNYLQPDPSQRRLGTAALFAGYLGGVGAIRVIDNFGYVSKPENLPSTGSVAWPLKLAGMSPDDASLLPRSQTGFAL